jgi:hypothetical protein
MTQDLLAARFDALTDGEDDSDWADVRRRAAGKRKRRVAIVVAAGVAAALAGPALGLHRVFIDFFKSEPAPARVQLDFNRMGVGAPAGMDPQVIPDSARRVITATYDGGTHTLWVAPTRKGGFCQLWTNGAGGCIDPKALSTTGRGKPDLGPTDLDPWMLGATYGSESDGIATLITGAVISKEVDKLSVEYADGARTQISLTWVSPPIDAGFYVLDVPAEHRQRGTHVSALVGTDRAGRVVARQSFRLPSPLDIEKRQQLPNGEWTLLPVKADATKARPVIDFRAANGNRITLWDVPTTTGARCYVFNRGGGCTPEDARTTAHPVPMAGGTLGGSKPVLWFANVRDDVASVEFRYEDGTVETAKPVEGFILREITEEHYALSRRLESVVARAADGHILQTEPVDTKAGGVYPCEKPQPLQYGVEMCP